MTVYELLSMVCRLPFKSIALFSILYGAVQAAELIPGSISSQNVGATGGTTARVLPDKLGDVLSVRDFGAKGDGVTSDTAAINAAADAVPPSGGVVRVPAGQYAITGGVDGLIYKAIRLHSNTTLRCEGATFIASGPSANSTVLVGNAGYRTPGTDHDIKVEGCAFSFPAWVIGNIGKAVVFGHMSRTSAINNACYDGAACIENEGVNEFEVSSNRAYNIESAAYDSYDGGTHGRITNNFADINNQYPADTECIQITNTDVSNNPTPVDDILIADNICMYRGQYGAPININGLTTTLTNHVSIRGNHLFSVGNSPPSEGVIVSAAFNNLVIDGNFIDNNPNAPAILVSSQFGVGAHITNNYLTNCGYGPTFTGNIQIRGMNSVVTGNHGSGCTGNPVSVTGTQNTVRDNDFGNGADANTDVVGAEVARQVAAGSLGAGSASLQSIAAGSLAPSSGVASVAASPGGGGSFFAPPMLTLTPPASGRTARARPTNMGLSTANLAYVGNIGNGGYTAGEVLTVQGGILTPGGSSATVIVNTVDGSGDPTMITGLTPGSYEVLPPSPQTLTGATGSGLTVSLQWYANGAVLTDPGFGYTPGSPPVVTASNCTSSGGYNTGCGSYTATLAPTTIAISGIPLCAAALTGQLCAASSSAGAAVSVK